MSDLSPSEALLSERARRMLVGVHPDLVRVVLAAREKHPFTVVEGLRTVERQRQLVDAGASKTMKSRHLTGHAVDLAPLVNGRVRWDWPLFPKMAESMKLAASDLGVRLVWGADWDEDGDWTDESFRDGPHFELSRKIYPAAPPPA